MRELTLDLRVLTLDLSTLFELTIALRELTLETNFISRMSEVANHRTLILCGGDWRELTLI